jgi:hypothetical protein
MREMLVYPPTEMNIKNNLSHFIKIYYKILTTFEKYPNVRFDTLPKIKGASGPPFKVGSAASPDDYWRCERKKREI